MDSELVKDLYELLKKGNNAGALILINKHKNLIYTKIAFIAAQTNNYHVLKRCLEIYENDVVAGASEFNILEHEYDDKKSTLLFAAIHASALKCIKLLVEHGANINAKNHRQMNALHLAIFLSYQSNLAQKYQEIVYYLWSQVKQLSKAEISAILCNRNEKSGDTLLTHAIEMRYWEIVKEILTKYPEVIEYESKKSLPLLHSLAGKGDKEAVEKVLAYCPQLAAEIMQPSKLSALHHATITTGKDQSILKMLLNAGVPINSKADANKLAEQMLAHYPGILSGDITPLGLAIFSSNYYAVTALVIWAKTHNVELLTAEDQASMGTYQGHLMN